MVVGTETSNFSKLVSMLLIGMCLALECLYIVSSELAFSLLHKRTGIHTMSITILNSVDNRSSKNNNFLTILFVLCFCKAQMRLTKCSIFVQIKCQRILNFWKSLATFQKR